MFESLFVYTLLFLVMYACGKTVARREFRYAAGSGVYEERGRFFSREMWILVLAFALIFGCRWGVGRDYFRYLMAYTGMVPERFEFLFQSLTLALKKTGLHFCFYFGLWALLVSYEHGSAASMQQLYANPAFDMRVKPYMRLTSNSDAVPVQVVPLGSDVKIAFTVNLPDDLLLKDVDFSGKVYNSMKKDVEKEFEKADCIMIEDGKAYVILVDTDELGVGSYLLKVTVQIPDTDYARGYRKEVVQINPHISVRG